jgi:signal transduction histidine kinase
MRCRQTILCFLLPLFAGLYFLLFLDGQSCFAQNNKLKPGTDTLYIKHLYGIAHKQSNPDSTLLLCKEPLRLSMAGNYADGILVVLTIMADANFKKSDFEQCILCYRKAISYCGEPVRKSMLFFDIGNRYNIEGDYVQASANFDSGLGILQNQHITNPRAYVIIYSSLGTLNYNFNQNSAALDYYNKAETYARSGKLHTDLVIVLSDKSNVYEEANKLDSALGCMLEAKSIVDKYDLKDNESEINEFLGAIYLESGHYETAINYLNAALDPTTLQLSEDPDLVSIHSYYCIGRALYFEKKYKQAESILVSTLKRAAALNVKENRPDAFRDLVNIYKATGQYKKALDCMDTISVMKDSLTGSQKAEAINRMQIKYQTAEKDKQISQNQLMIAHQKNKIAQKNIWMLSISSVMVLLILTSAGVYLHTLNKERSREKENKIEILKAELAGGDSERSRIARDLHDGIGGMLSAAMMRFSSMHYENPEITRTTAYNDAMTILHEMGEEIRKTAHNLMPEVLLKQSLPDAVRQFCNNVREEGKIKIDFQTFGSFDNLAQSYKLNLYRIIQELVKNATIHSGADRILVQFLQNGDKLIVSVEDNGHGFSTKEPTGGLGLHNIRTRVNGMDGHFTLESEPGKGTTAIIELELTSLAEPEEKTGAASPAA